MTITEFLLARIAEDEAAAHASIEASEMYPYGDRRLPRLSVDEIPDAIRNYLGGTWGEHFARHDPARVFAECAAKRRIIEQAAHCNSNYGGTVTAAVSRSCYLTVLTHLAAAYAEHSDYREDWSL